MGCAVYRHPLRARQGLVRQQAISSKGPWSRRQEMKICSRAVRFLALAAMAAAVPCARAQSPMDQVFLAKPPPVRGVIPSDNAVTRDKVTIETSGVPREIAVNEITRIMFKEEPVELNVARNHVLQKNYGLAMNELKK